MSGETWQKINELFATGKNIPQDHFERGGQIAENSKQNPVVATEIVKRFKMMAEEADILPADVIILNKVEKVVFRSTNVGHIVSCSSPELFTELTVRLDTSNLTLLLFIWFELDGFTLLTPIWMVGPNNRSNNDGKSQIWLSDIHGPTNRIKLRLSILSLMQSVTDKITNFILSKEPPPAVIFKRFHDYPWLGAKYEQQLNLRELHHIPWMFIVVTCILCEMKLKPAPLADVQFAVLSTVGNPDPVLQILVFEMAAMLLGNISPRLASTQSAYAQGTTIRVTI